MPERSAREMRALAHRAVTEGVDLRYVERMRQALYAAADRIEELEAGEPPKHGRYKLTFQGDDYPSMDALATVGRLIPGCEYEWEVRSDEELRGGVAGV